MKDRETAEKLLPRDHPFASKRALIDTDYFETYNRDNIRLVDIRHFPIEEITPAGIRIADGREHELYIIVFATGYDGMTGSFFEDGHPRPRWSGTEAEVERGAQDLPGGRESHGLVDAAAMG